MSDAEIITYLQSKMVRSQVIPGTWWLHFFGEYTDLRKCVEQRFKHEQEQNLKDKK